MMQDYIVFVGVNIVLAWSVYVILLAGSLSFANGGFMAIGAYASGDPFPLVKWVSIDDGGREAGDPLEDKAATFVPNQNTLLVNSDFRVFKDMVARLCKEKEAGPGLEDAVKEIVHQWFEQALVETVIGVKQLQGSKEWGPEEIDRALSSEALTSAVMQRYHVYIACRRELGARFGKRFTQAAP